MQQIAPPTAKGARQAQTILDATLRCLGRDGYHATSLQRIAAEAGVQKRMVSYYYGTREKLIEHAIRELGDRLIEQTTQAVAGLEEPADIITAGFERIWTSITTDRALLVAYYGLTAESVTDPNLKPATAYITDRLRELIATLIDDAKSRGRRILLEEGSLTTLVIAILQGLILDYLEHGHTPQLQDAINDAQTGLAQLAPQADNRTLSEPRE